MLVCCQIYRYVGTPTCLRLLKGEKYIVRYQAEFLAELVMQDQTRSQTFVKFCIYSTFGQICE